MKGIGLRCFAKPHRAKPAYRETDCFQNKGPDCSGPLFLLSSGYFLAGIVASPPAKALIMPHRFPPLAPPEPRAVPSAAQVLQALPLAELCLMFLIGLALLLA